MAADERVQEERIRVLVCDDNAPFAQALSVMLSAEPQLEVAGVARDGEEALRLAEALAPVDVILLDIEMPGMGGIEVLRVLRGWKQRPAVMMLTGVSDSDVIERAQREQPDAFLRKSVDPDEMVTGILIIGQMVRAATPAVEPA
jgi:DNA-binding NarL/FixJ family response regulator